MTMYFVTACEYATGSQAVTKLEAIEQGQIS